MSEQGKWDCGRDDVVTHDQSDTEKDHILIAKQVLTLTSLELGPCTLGDCDTVENTTATLIFADISLECTHTEL